MPVLSGIGDDRAFALEAVRCPVPSPAYRVDLINTVLKEIRQPLLEELQRITRRFDGSMATASFRDLESRVLACCGLLVEYVRYSLRLEVEQLRQVAQRFRCF